MRLWKLLALLLAASYAVYYYHVPSAVYAQLAALNFKQTGFESDTIKPPVPANPAAIKTATGTPDVFATINRVVDGDTIVIDTGQKVRYIGMNTPESVDPRKPVQCFGKEASNYNKVLVVGKKVKLVKDVGDKDKYGRLLRYVYLEDGTFVNLKLVEDGYANVMTIPPNVAHAADFTAAEKKAREAGRGLWSACK